ncbi:hypothetical protein H7K24_17065 [Mycobacterium fragae]|uniref:Uncharacterized protein n=1 Tax=Mycobacterium fragae TaxID=1260918 RepID=A0A1X1UR62_9MYCO|nr:hypothetical protein [Mycobacterium fragae]MCV7401853.1 hypothetical protein [Mycobacterium fragae]ORV59323.1 hypothetical protein AWC06_18365 [Mycobacterium fragae]
MQITEDQFQKFSSHLVTWHGARAPQVLIFTVAALLADPDGIKESLCSYQPGPDRTVWIAHLLTGGALIVVHLEVDAEQYDRQAEYRYQVGGNAQNAPGCQIKQAWARPLADVTSYQVDIQAVLGSDWFGARVQLTFSNAHEPVSLPAQPFDGDQEERERSDNFLEVLRDSISWLG